MTVPELPYADGPGPCLAVLETFTPEQLRAILEDPYGHEDMIVRAARAALTKAMGEGQ